MGLTIKLYFCQVDLKIYILLLVTFLSSAGMLWFAFVYRKTNRPYHQILAFYFFCILIIFLSNTLINIQGKNSTNSFVILASYLFFPALLSLAPTIFLYTQSFTFEKKDRGIFSENIKHFLLPVALLIVNVFSYLALLQLDYNSQNAQLISEILKYINFIALFFVFLVQNIFYIVVSIRTYQDHKKEYQLEKKENYLTLNWLKYFLFSYAVIFICIYVFQINGIDNFKILFRIIFVLYLISLIVLGRKSYSILLSMPIDNLMNDEQKKNLREKINYAIKEERIYLDKNLNLQSFAKRINSNTKYLSKFINQEYDQNFSSFINKYRIEEAKKMLKDSKNDIYTMETLAGMTGYGSKSSFNNAFKKITGLTPSEYKRQSN